MMRSNAYLRAAQAYMLISMPIGTSVIFGAFHAIPELLKMADVHLEIKYCGSKSSPVKYSGLDGTFAMRNGNLCSVCNSNT
jgi:hypothetical protein